MYDRIVGRLKEETLAYYGDRLVSLCVFGSVGRGTPNPYSDIDLLIVAEPLPNGRLRRGEEFLVVEERLQPLLREARELGVETALSPFFKTPREVEHGSWLFLDLIEDGLILFDRDEFLGRYLRTLQERLRQRGAKRIKRGEVWHWVLTPENRPDEVVEL